MRVGFIGLGSQGGPMARRIVGAGYPTTVWARRPATLESFADTPAEVVDSPAALAAAGDLVRLSVVGDADVVERCRPVFGTCGDPVVHLGELGSGQTTKLLNNLLFTANLGTAATALSLAGALGVDPDRLAGVAGGLLRKDVGLVVDLAGRAAASPGVVLDAADVTLDRMGHRRPSSTPPSAAARTTSRPAGSRCSWAAPTTR